MRRSTGDKDPDLYVCRQEIRIQSSSTKKQAKDARKITFQEYLIEMVCGRKLMGV